MIVELILTATLINGHGLVSWSLLALLFAFIASTAPILTLALIHD